ADLDREPDQPAAGDRGPGGAGGRGSQPRRPARGRQHLRLPVPAATAGARRGRGGALHHQVPGRPLRRRGRRAGRLRPGPGRGAGVPPERDGRGRRPVRRLAHPARHPHPGGADGAALRQRGTGRGVPDPAPGGDPGALPGPARPPGPQDRRGADAPVRRHGVLPDRGRGAGGGGGLQPGPPVHARGVAGRGGVADRTPGPDDTRLRGRLAAGGARGPGAPVGRDRDGRRPARRPGPGAGRGGGPGHRAGATLTVGSGGTVERSGWVGATAKEIAWAVRRGDVSATQVVADHLDHIRAHERTLGALRMVRDVEALAEAEQVDQQEDLSGAWLAGVPVVVKEHAAVAGLPVWHGSAAARTAVAEADHEVVRRLRGAGAVVVGLSRMPELGLWATTDDATAVTRNPWHPGRTPGGSSGGAAAAVADAVVGFAVLAGTRPAALAEPDRLRVAVSVRGATGLPPDGPNRQAVTIAGRALVAAGHDLVRADPAYPVWLSPVGLATWVAGAYVVAEEVGLPPEAMQPRTRRHAALGRVAGRRGLVPDIDR